MAKEGALDELLAEVLSRYDNSPNPRLKEVTCAAIRHLHAFAREVNLTREEWFAGIMFLTQCGKISDDVRQEFILLSDTTGVSTLVEMLAYDASSSSLTDNTVLGPFHADGSPDREFGESMLVDPDDG
ncbi:MAG: dioxygenase, partial [Ilumatobacteraceae bacterium]